MSHSTVPFEQECKVSAGYGHHGKPVPVWLKGSDCLWIDPVQRKNLNASVPIQGIICLLEVQEYLKEDRLHHRRKMMKQICLERGGPHPTSRPKPVHHIIKLIGTKCLLPKNIVLGPLILHFSLGVVLVLIPDFSICHEF